MRFHPGATLTHWGHAYPKKKALSVGRVSLDYGSLNRATDGLATVLKEQGAGKGDSVGVVCPNSPEFVEALYAGLKLGAVVVPLASTLKVSPLARMITNAGCRMVFMHESLASLAELAEHCRVLSLGTRTVRWSDSSGVIHSLDYCDIARAEALAVPGDDIDFNDVLGILYSSGTTGVPRGIVKNHWSVLSELLVWIIEMQLGFEDTLLLSTPLYYTGGLLLLLAAVFVGAHSVVMSRFDTQNWLREVETHKATHAFLVPTQIRRILKLGKEGFDTSSLRLIVVMSDICTPDEKLELARRLGCDVIEVWGNTEGVGTVAKPRDLRSKPGSIGKPFLTDEVRVVDDHMNDVGPGVVGNLIGKTDSAFNGYHARPDLTDQVLKDGWIVSGDMGWIDEDGYFYFAGRAKDILKVGGTTVYPADLEEVLLRHPAVEEAVVFGRPDDDLLEKPVAAVVLRTGAVAKPHAILSWANEQLSKPQQIADVITRKDFPRTAAGKVKKRLVRTEYLRSLGGDLGEEATS